MPFKHTKARHMVTGGRGAKNEGRYRTKERMEAVKIRQRTIRRGWGLKQACQVAIQAYSDNERIHTLGRNEIVRINGRYG